MDPRTLLAPDELAARLAPLAERDDWRGWVMAHLLHDRPAALAAVQERLDDATYWSTLANLTGGCAAREMVWAQTVVHALLASPRPGREHLMRPDERRALATLPAAVRVYTGEAPGTQPWIWTTLARDAADDVEDFRLDGRAERLARVSRALCPRAAVRAYWTRARMFEVAADPADLIDVEVLSAADTARARFYLPPLGDCGAAASVAQRRP